MPDSKALKYEFFTPYHRGYDLVFDFVFAQPERRFSLGVWSIQASLGYERAQDTKVCAEDRYVGSAHSISERFAPIVQPYRDFMAAVERAATQWAADKQRDKDAEALKYRSDDDALCARVLALSEPPHNSVEE